MFFSFNYRYLKLIHLPIIGICLFVFLYIVATLYYPGGSQANTHSHGFSWINNYWCNLLNENAINGQFNPARPIALAAMFVLCFSLALFWFLFPFYILVNKYVRYAIQFGGIVSMMIAIFLFTRFHDAVINMAGIFGLMALVGTYIAIYQQRWKRLFAFGIFNLLLIAINNILYYGNELKQLPVVQKLSFLSFLVWIVLINIQLIKIKK